MATEKTIKPTSDGTNPRFCPNCGNQLLKPWRDLTEDERFIAVRRGFLAECEPRPGERFCARCMTHVPEAANESA